MSGGELNTYPVQEDVRFQKAVWVIERVSWVLLALVPLAALAGVFSHGPLSDRTIQAADGAFSIEYERFQRVTVQARFVLRAASADSEELRLHLNTAFQLSYDIQSIQPEPLQASAGAEGLDLYFRTDDGALTAVIWATPRHHGWTDIRAEIEGAGVEMPVLVYP